jgi:HEPN domain-containing protein
LGIKPEENIGDFIDELNDQGVLTRYPNELSSLIKAYNKEKASRILLNTKEVLKWIKKI